MDINIDGFDDFFCFNVRKYNRRITNFFDNCLKGIGVRSTQVHLLLAISLEKESLTKISKHLGMDRTTLTRGIAPLERGGLIKRIDSGNNREKIYALTDSGKDIAKKGADLIRSAQSIMFKNYGSERYAMLVECMRS